MRKDSIRLDNAFNRLLLADIGIVAEDVLLALICEIMYCKSDSESIELSVEELKYKINRPKYSNKTIIKKLLIIKDNLTIINMDSLKPEPIQIFDFRVNNNIITIILKPSFNSFKTYKKDNQRFYFRMRLSQYMQIKSSAGRLVYRLCAQWQFQGRTQVYKIKTIKTLLGIEDTSKVLSKLREGVESVNQFKLAITMLTYAVITHKRGRPEIDAVAFTFSNRCRSNEPKKAWHCPICGAQLYEKQNKTTGEVFYAHITKNGKCKATFSTIAQIKNYSETPKRDDSFNNNENDEIESLADQINNAFD